MEMMNRDKRERLLGYVERIERLEEAKANLAQDISQIYAEAKDHGYDTKTIRKVVAERKIDASVREEQMSLFDAYWDAVNTPNIMTLARTNTRVSVRMAEA